MSQPQPTTLSSKACIATAPKGAVGDRPFFTSSIMDLHILAPITVSMSVQALVVVFLAYPSIVAAEGQAPISAQNQDHPAIVQEKPQGDMANNLLAQLAQKQDQLTAAKAAAQAATQAVDMLKSEMLTAESDLTSLREDTLCMASQSRRPAFEPGSVQ